MTTAKTPNRKMIASVQRALDILNLFTNEQTELGNVEIARLVDLPVGTVSGLVYTLKVYHYLDQNPANRKYRLGLKLAERAEVLLQALDLRKIAGPYLEALRDGCGESVNLAVRDGNEVVYIERMFGSHSLGIRSELGKRGPLHSTALGKAILAYLPARELAEVLGNYEFFEVTQYTLTSAGLLEQDCCAIRTRGFAVDEQENELGGRCVAAPVFDLKSYPVAAVSVSVPLQRMPDGEVERLGGQVRETALRISEKLGYLCSKC